MTIEQRLTFINAGYTKDEISAMEAVENPTPPEEPPKPVEPEPPKPIEQEPPKPVEPEKQGNDNKAVLDAIAALTAAIQLSNVQRTSFDDNPPLDAVTALAQGVYGNKTK